MVVTWYGEYRQLRRRVKEYAKLDCRVSVLNDGWPDTGLFNHICNQGPNVLAFSKDRDEGFCSHQLRNWAMDMADTEWVAMLDLDCGLPWCFPSCFNYHDFDAAPRWMFELTKPVEGYEPFPTDKRKLTKGRVHPNCHIVPRNMARYDEQFFGQHAGDQEFFEKLAPDYSLFPVALEMEPRSMAT